MAKAQHDIQRLYDRRLNLVEEAGRIVSDCESEDRLMTDEESTRFEKIHEDVEKLRKQIDNEEAQRNLESELNEVRSTHEPQLAESPVEDTEAEDTGRRTAAKDQKERERSVFIRALVQGVNDLDAETRNFFRGYQRDLKTRAQSVGTDTEGGFLAPDGFIRQIETAMLEFGGMREARTTVLRTSHGRVLEWPTSDDTGKVGAILAENTQVSEDDVVFGVTPLEAYKYTSNLVRVSTEFLQDVDVDAIESWLVARLSERIARITNTHFTTGSGTAQPNGVVTAATVGETAASATAITADELLNLEHSVDPAYRANAEWMFNDATLLAIKKLVNSNGNPVWFAGRTLGQRDLIDSYPFVINQDVADIASDALSVVFGDFSKYIIRDVAAMRVLRLSERYADFDQTGFVLFTRHDGELIDAGTNPVKTLQQAT